MNSSLERFKLVLYLPPSYIVLYHLPDLLGSRLEARFERQRLAREVGRHRHVVKLSFHRPIIADMHNIERPQYARYHNEQGIGCNVSSGARSATKTPMMLRQVGVFEPALRPEHLRILVN